jgi:aspartyl-tRNA(Asn)/glutamyl-tRNA(Gln) amidotransferase subunit A
MSVNAAGAPSNVSAPVSFADRVSAQLEATERLNPTLNAVISVFDDAVEQAERVETALQTGSDTGILAGVTVSVKDVIDTAGHLTTMGSRFFATNVPISDAEVVARLRRSDAVLVSKSNLSEFAMGATSQNPHYGFVHNAWDTDCVAGGSSGGSAVAVAAGLADVALGTDTGGSVLVPSALNGIVGLRPSIGRVSNRGVFPVSAHFDTVGPMARTVRETRRLFAAIEGYDPLDPHQRKQLAAVRMAGTEPLIRGMRIGVPRKYFHADDAIMAGVSEALGALEQLGADIVDIGLDGAEDAPGNMARMMFADFLLAHEERYASSPERFGEDLRYRLQLGSDSTGLEYARGRRWALHWRATLDHAFQTVDVVVTPTVTTTAPLIAESTTVTTSPMLTRFTHPWCLSDGATLSIPCGFDKNGRPFAMQLSGPAMSEDTLFTIGEAYQQATDWHRLRPPIMHAAGVSTRVVTS